MSTSLRCDCERCKAFTRKSVGKKMYFAAAALCTGTTKSAGVRGRSYEAYGIVTSCMPEHDLEEIQKQIEVAAKSINFSTRAMRRDEANNS